MTRALHFGSTACLEDGRRVRRARFRARSSLPISAACVVANGMRESLRSLFAIDVDVRLLEPIVPSAEAWALIGSEAVTFLVAGPLGEAAIILRPRDALAIAGLAFGETAPETRPLSAIEDGVIARAMTELSKDLAPICGLMDRFRVSRITPPLSFAAFFELLLEGPVRASIGIAVAREITSAAPRDCLQLADLLDVDLPATAQIASARMPAEDFLSFAPGKQVVFNAAVHALAKLTVDGRTVAIGEAGNRGGRGAFQVIECAGTAGHP